MEKPITNAKLKFNCPINWDTMEDTHGGKNCNVCQKKVFDLTNCSQNEMDIILIQNNYNICAKFSSQQLSPRPISFPFRRKWVSAAIVLLGFNLFNGKAVAQKIKVIGMDNFYSQIPEGSLGEVIIFGYGKNNDAPKFPGNIDTLNNFLEKHITFKSHQDDVYVQFGIDSNGVVKTFKILKGADPITAEDAANIVKLSPRWIPAKINGKPVYIDYGIHLTFVP